MLNICKPSGTVSQLVDCASGIHGRFSPYYIRTVRADQKDPLAQFMIHQGFPYEVDKMKPEHQYVFSFPQKSPKGSLMSSDITSEVQLEIWNMFHEHWCEHKPSVTIYYKDSEFLSLGQVVYNSFNTVSGISFLPYSDHVYEQAPYQAITEQEYNALLSAMPKNVDWSLAAAYDKGIDQTTSSKELACVAGVCEL